MISLSTRTKEAIKTGLAMTIAYGIALQMDWDRPYWASFAVAFISLPTAVFFEGNKFFAEVPLFDELLPSRHGAKNAVVFLCLRHQDSVSSTALKLLQRYTAELRQSGNLLMLAGVEPHVMQELNKAELTDQIGKENIFEARSILEASLHEALEAAEVWLQNQKKDS
jgi:anti-anti-sigma regulatory factor